MKKIIEMPHHVDDYECMWNGIEDLYIQRTRETLPPNLFFVLASFGSVCYLKTPASTLKRMIALGDGRTRKMYEFLAPIVGFDYKEYNYDSFEKALNKAKIEIDQGFPVVIGTLDMSYLPYYPKLYHHGSIPFHYVLMVGYDENQIFIQDCGREGQIALDNSDLKLAWNASFPGLSKPFSLFTIRMNQSKQKEEIVKEALQKKAKAFLNPPVGFVGHKGMDKFINDFPNYLEEFSKEDLDMILLNMVQFMGTVPTIPNALKGIDVPDKVKFYGGFDKVSRVLNELGNEFENPKWLEAAQVLEKGCLLVEKIKEVIVGHLLGEDEKMEEIPKLFANIKNLMSSAFKLLIED